MLEGTKWGHISSRMNGFVLLKVNGARRVWPYNLPWLSGKGSWRERSIQAEIKTKQSTDWIQCMNAWQWVQNAGGTTLYMLGEFEYLLIKKRCLYGEMSGASLTSLSPLLTWLPLHRSLKESGDPKPTQLMTEIYHPLPHIIHLSNLLQIIGVSECQWSLSYSERDAENCNTVVNISSPWFPLNSLSLSLTG